MMDSNANIFDYKMSQVGISLQEIKDTLDKNNEKIEDLNNAVIRQTEIINRFYKVEENYTQLILNQNKLEVEIKQLNKWKWFLLSTICLAIIRDILQQIGIG